MKLWGEKSYGMEFSKGLALASPYRGIQTFSVSGPHWKKESCLGPHIKYIATYNQEKKETHVLSKFTTLCWATFTAILAACGRTPASGVSVPNISFLHTNVKIDLVKQNSVLHTSSLFDDIRNDICSPGKDFKQKYLFKLIYCSD